MPIESQASPKPKRPRVDRRRNIEKVAAAVLKHPRADCRKIAKVAGVSPSTAASVKRSGELAQTCTQDDRVFAIVNRDAKILEMSQQGIVSRLESDLEVQAKNAEVIRKLKDPEIGFEERMRLTESLQLPTLGITEINSVARDSAARYVLFRGALPNKDGQDEVLTKEQAEKLTAALNALGRG